MNKKIKSLIVSGLLMVGMTGLSFADGNGNDGCQVPNLRGHEGSNEHKIENITQGTWEEYVNTVNTTNTGIVIEAPNNLNGNGWHTYKVYKDEDFDHVKDDGQQIEVLHVKFNVPLTDEEREEKNNDPVPTPPPVPPTPVNPPELPEEDPETGDSSSLIYVGTALASVLGVYMLNKKDEE